MIRDLRNLLSLLGLATVLFFANLGGFDLWPPDEPRYAQVAREMMQSGDYIVPRVNGQSYREKPPLMMWAIIAASQPFGDVSEWSARAPSACAGLVVLLLTWILARRLYGGRVAFWAVLFLITCKRFWWQGRFGQIDMLLCIFLTASLLFFWLWHERRRAGWLVAFYLACAAALYAKGPGVLIFPTLLVLTFRWERYPWRPLIPKIRAVWRQIEGPGSPHLVLGMLAAMALFLVWAIPARLLDPSVSGAEVDDAMAANLFRQTIGRFLLGVSHANPPWYYLYNTPIDWLPWSLFLPWSLPWVWRRRNEGAAMRLLLCWTVPAFIFFSIAIGKRQIYVFPLFPAFAILFSLSVLDLMDSAREVWRRRTALVWAGLLLLLAIAPLVLPLTDYREIWRPTLLLFSGAALAMGIEIAVRAWRGPMRNLHATMAAHFTILALLTGVILFPAVNTSRSVRDFCAPVRQMADAGVDFQLYSVGFSREEYVFYSHRFHTPVFMELLPIKSTQGMSPMAQMRFQKRIVNEVEDAIEDIPIADYDRVTEAEVQHLFATVHDAAGKLKVDQALLAEFEEALQVAGAEFFASIHAGTPAFYFIEQADWRWLLALNPDIRKLDCIHTMRVGRRNVMLFANEAAASMLPAEPVDSIPRHTTSP